MVIRHPPRSNSLGPVLKHSTLWIRDGAKSWHIHQITYAGSESHNTYHCLSLPISIYITAYQRIPLYITAYHCLFFIGGGGGWVGGGGVAAKAIRQALILFKSQICIFLHPVSNQTAEVNTLFQIRQNTHSY